MSTISRRASYRIITRAVQRVDEPLVGVLPAGADDYQACADSDELKAALQQRPGAMVFLGGTPPDVDLRTAPPNHSNRVNFDESAMTTGIALYAAAALRHLTPAG